MLSGDPATESAMLMSSYGRTVEFFKASDLGSALAVTAEDGWKPFASVSPDNGSWRIIVARPTQ